MKNKNFKKIEEQIDLQKNRGLKNIDVKVFYDYILSNNYFNVINGHESLFLKNKNKKEYINNITFSDYIRIHELEKSISKELFEQLARFESALTTSIAYRFSEKYNTDIHYNNTCYQEITNYSIPQEDSGPERLIKYFYNIDNQGKIYNSHKFFKKHVKNNLRVKDIKFTGICEIGSSPSTSNKLFFKGEFFGNFVGCGERNRYSGTFIVEQNSNLNNLTVTTGAQLTSFRIPDGTLGNFTSLNYSDLCKLEYLYISKYEYPPLWIIINTLMVNDIIILFIGLDPDIQNKVMDDLEFNGMKSSRKDEFITLLEVFREIRNEVAHSGLITKYETSESIKINSNLIQRLNLSPKLQESRIRLLDIIKILNEVNVFNNKKLKSKIKKYLIINLLFRKRNINLAFLERIK
ncbi:hypothetical protein BOVMAS33_14540 [Streptococcus uberis]